MNLYFKGKSHHSGKYFSDFSFFPYMILYGTVSFIELDFWTVIDSTIRLKNTLKRYWFGFFSPYSSMKNEMTIDFFSELIECSVFTFLNPWWDMRFSMAFFKVAKAMRISLWQLCSITLWRKWQSSGVLQFHLWLDFRL